MHAYGHAWWHSGRNLAATLCHEFELVFKSLGGDRLVSEQAVAPVLHAAQNLLRRPSRQKSAASGRGRRRPRWWSPEDPRLLSM